MALPKLIPADHIEKLEVEQHKAFRNMVNQHDKSTVEGNPVKQQWLAVYSRTLSPKIACDRAGISIETYRSWRSKDASFCRAINRCIEDARDELMGSVINRATGYLQAADDNSPTESGYKEDATGKPIHFGGSDQLAKSLLQLDDEVKGNSPTLNVVLEFSRITSNAAHLLEHMGGEADE